MKRQVRKKINFASPWQRLFAWLIDMVIISIIYYFATQFIPQKVLNQTLSPLKAITSPTPQLLPDLKFVFLKTYLSINLLNSLINYAYSVYLIGSRGQTIGKIIVGVKVVDIASHKHPSYLVAIVRETIGKFISGLFLGLGYFWILWDKKKQSWHDKIAGTIVVKI